jgi:hypothetical protein
MFTYVDTIEQGASYLREYSTGSFSIAGTTPRLSLLDSVTNVVVATFHYSVIDENTLNIALLYQETAGLDPSKKYYSCMDFLVGETIYRHGKGQYTVAQGR